MKEYKIVVLSPGVQVLAERHLYGDETLVAKRCQDFPRHPGFWVSML